MKEEAGSRDIVKHHSVAWQCFYTVVRSSSQSYGDSKISGGQNPKTPEPIDQKFDVGDYVGDDSPPSQTQNKLPIGGVAAYA